MHMVRGPAAKRGLGVAATAVPGLARQGIARTWAGVYDVPKQREYSFNKYSKQYANTLAREWCRRAQYFCNPYFNKIEEDFE